MDCEAPRFKKKSEAEWAIISIKTGRDVEVGGLFRLDGEWKVLIHQGNPIGLMWLDHIAGKIREMNRDLQFKSDMERFRKENPRYEKR